MLLLAHGIRFANPLGKLFIQIRNTVHAKCVQVISRRESLDARKPRMLNPSRKNKVADQMVSSDLHSDE